MRTISGFDGEYRWLSNFWPADVCMDGVTWPTVEHAYQAAKSADPEYREVIAGCGTPGIAKFCGHQAQLRADWDYVRVDLMETLVHQKFIRHPELATALLETGDAYLEELNGWGDRFWGVDSKSGRGLNMLGHILMHVREELAACLTP